MPATAASRPATSRARQPRHRTSNPEATARRMPVQSASVSTPARRSEGTSPIDQPRVKTWQVALGFLALLCSGIDLG